MEAFFFSVFHANPIEAALVYRHSEDSLFFKKAAAPKPGHSAERCPECSGRRLKPQFAKAEEKLRELNSKVLLAQTKWQPEIGCAANKVQNASKI